MRKFFYYFAFLFLAPLLGAQTTERSPIYIDDDGVQQPGYDSAAPIGSLHNPYSTIQMAANVATSGDLILVRAGNYYSGSSAASMPILRLNTSQGGELGNPVTLRAAANERAILNGNGVTQDLMILEGKFIDIEGFEFTGALRTAIEIRGNAQTTHHINVRNCHAYDNGGDLNFIGAAFRTVGPVQYIVFEDCISERNAGGFQFRESPTQTTATALVPPVAGNTGFALNLPESQWDEWEGWTEIAARYCTVRRCLAIDNRLIAEHSDGFACRYSIQCTFEDNIAFGNSDDGFDMLGATRCVIRRNIAFDSNPTGELNGDGNGIKVGVRGGLENLVAYNICFENPRAGIDLADTERARCFNNTVYANAWFGIWSEATRATLRGSEILNNLCVSNHKDMGAAASALMSHVDYNAVSDNNVHTGWIYLGIHSFINFDPQFLREDLVINRSFPIRANIPQRLEFIRSQVKRKLSLSAKSPAIDAGIFIRGISQEISGDAPDLGALPRR